jgi:hypothetical protein
LISRIIIMFNPALPSVSADRQLTYPTAIEIAVACSEDEMAKLVYPTVPIPITQCATGSILGPDGFIRINMAAAFAMLEGAKSFWIYIKKSYCAVSVMYRRTRFAVRPGPAICHFARTRRYTERNFHAD